MKPGAGSTETLTPNNPMKTRLLITLACAALAAFTHPATAAPGDLDLTFGGTGKVTNQGGSAFDFAQSLAINADGSIIVAGSSRFSGVSNPLARFQLVRWSANGSFAWRRSVSFSGAGDGEGDTARSVAFQSDGKIVVVGHAVDGYHFTYNRSIALARFNPDGTIDSTFGGGGMVLTKFGGTGYGDSVAIQNDGKIVVAGSVLARFDTNGTLDSSFGTAGSVALVGRSVALQSDGKIVVVGTGLTRCLSNGSLDPSFGIGGSVSSIGGTSLALLGNGKIVVAGGESLMRCNADGTLDTSFNVTGSVTLPFFAASGDRSVAVQSNGKIIVVGSLNGDFASVRYNANGTLDGTFNGNGMVATDFVGNADTGYGVAVQADGKIVACGTSFVPAIPFPMGSEQHYDFSIVRYQGDNDTTTLPPTLIEPASGAVAPSTVSVMFTLPERALAGSVRLTFNDGIATRVLTLATGNESAGAHSFTFDPAHPLQSAAIVSGPSIPDGIYTVTLSYQDALANAAASSLPALNVTVYIDTDGDGILDRYETGTGVYVSPTDTGTSPTNPDSDGDGLTDSQEVNVIHSNPNLHDTDGDGFDDGVEVATGFSPTSAASTPDSLSSIRTAAEYRFNAANGISYRIETSTDLATWTTLETPIIGTGGVITRFYSIEGQAKRFFRSRRN